MRYSSVECTSVVPVRARRRLRFFVCIKCRLPALERNTLPLAVILNRLATDFLVLIPLGRRIILYSVKKSAQYRCSHPLMQGRFLKFYWIITTWTIGAGSLSPGGEGERFSFRLFGLQLVTLLPRSPNFRPETFWPLRAGMGFGLSVVCVQAAFGTMRAE